MRPTRATPFLSLVAFAALASGVTCGSDESLAPIGGGAGGNGATSTSSTAGSTSSHASSTVATGGSSSSANTTSTGGSGGAGGTGGTTCAALYQVALTVKNVGDQCAVSINNVPQTGAQTTLCEPAEFGSGGAVPNIVMLTATAHGGYELGSTPWHRTDDDTGDGDPGTRSGSGQDEKSSATISLSYTSGDAVCVWVCCETAGQADCPTTDLCP
ncbi:MAG TPA: hypothetical protein VGM56_16335 [Byssovorax sp.]